ncbi:MAG: hypothetical protein MSH18_03730 [Bacteroidales bacterium]|nr:hypothetical protein [Bacteroidales bacterium]
MANKVYLNKMQRDVMSLGAKDNVIVAGRGTGKGVLHAGKLLQVAQAMPRSTSAFVAPSRTRAFTNTLPSMLVHLEKWGYKQGLHWTIGIKPPKHLNFPKPIYEPADWSDFIAFYTGAVVQIVSQERKGTSNSKSFDYLLIDEAKFVDFEQLKDETFPANRGQVAEFGHLPFHHGMLITSDMPITKAGSWFLNYEKDCDPALIETIRGVQTELAYFRQADETTYTKRKVRELTAVLQELQRNALYFQKYSSLTNMEILGEEYIKQQRRDLPYLVFRTSILCLPVEMLRDGFYSSMKMSHRYTPGTSDYISTLGFERVGSVEISSRLDADVLPFEPLCVAFDFNANINWMVVGQIVREEGRLLVLRSFFVKYERKLPELVSDFCTYYAPHPTKQVVFYYDATALGSNYAVNNEDFAFVVTKCFERHGWNVLPVYIGQPMRHVDKHLLINRGFAGANTLTPYFNEEANEALLISITQAGVYNGKKDKRGEKLAETEEDRLESRTDGSDAFDTLYIGCERFPQTHLGIIIATCAPV